MHTQAIDANIIIQILGRLIGEITPYGSHSIDEMRHRNLDHALVVADWLIGEIEESAKLYYRPEASIKGISGTAHSWLKNKAEDLAFEYLIEEQLWMILEENFGEGKR